MTTYTPASEEQFLAIMEAAGLDTSEEEVAFLREWDQTLAGLELEELAALREILHEMQAMTPAERLAFAEHLRRSKLTPEAARGAIMAALERGEEPDGTLFGDWLTVDPALQAFFQQMYRTLVVAPGQVLHLQPQGLIIAA